MPKLIIKDLGIGKLREQLAELGGLQVTFGYQGPSGAQLHPGSDRYSVAGVAYMHEFGVGVQGGEVDFPARPLGRTTMEENRELFATAVKRAASDLIDGRASNAMEVAEQLGELAVSKLRKTLDRSREWAAANAASTVRAKGHDQPLIGEFATLYEQASWAIRRGDQIIKQGGEG